MINAPDADQAPIDRRDPSAGAPLRWSSEWCVEDGGDHELVLSAGADRRVAVDGLVRAHIDLVRSWQSGAPVAVPVGVEPLVDRLVEVGALGPDVPLVLAVGLLGDPIVTAEVASHLRDASVVAVPEADLVIVVRTGEAWPDLGTLAPDQPHLGVDLALHHTVVLGPLVVPAASSCLQCLDTRTTGRWGRTAVPERPAVQRRLAAVAALVDIQLALVGRGASTLINGTTAWDLEGGAVVTERLYRVTGCPGCAPVAPAPRVALRWAP